MLAISRYAFLLTVYATTGATAQTAAVGDAELVARLVVNGVRVSADSKIAIINDRLAHIGEQVGGAQVIAIESNLVHMRIANRSFAMRVGSSLIRESHFGDGPGVALAATQRPEPSPSLPAQRPTQPDPAFEPDRQVKLSADEFFWPVARGETLSEIADSLTTSGHERQALMAEIFAQNPQAFGDSMDLLYAGVRLAVTRAVPRPAAAVRDDVLEAQATAQATRAPSQQHLYGPVQPGDTLSAIAAGLVTENITLNQFMLAIFAANPGSFGDNLNLLYAGKFLTIPDAGDWHLQMPQAAQTEVDRQAAVWQAAAVPANST